MKVRVLVSVYNISGYLLAELEALSAMADIAVVETPCGICKGKLEKAVRWLDRREIKSVGDFRARLGDFVPDLYLCGGWSDRLFVDLARDIHRAGGKTVLLVDTPWKGTLRQYVHCVLSRFTLLPIFDYAWGAGEPQERHLRYLGFPMKRIRRGYYCADTHKFAPIGEGRIAGHGKTCKWPHVVLYVGRYIAVKNMRRMERAFIKAADGTDWTLLCIGNGDLWNERTIHPRITHLGYKSPAEIQEFVKGAGCFVLPSVYEPWGVVVHEAALMGLPMLCSNQIQAATAYLREGENGYLFNPLDEDDITSAFKRVMALGDDELLAMGRRSHQLGMSYTLSDWCRTVLEFVGVKE